MFKTVNSTKLVATKKPRKRLPPSPKKIFRFLLLEKLKNKKTIKLHKRIGSKSTSDSSNLTFPKINKTNKEIIIKLEERPSQPSIILIAFVRAIIAINVNGTESKPSSKGLEKPNGVPKLVTKFLVIIMNINVIIVWKNNFEETDKLNLSSITPNIRMDPPQINRVMK